MTSTTYTRPTDSVVRTSTGSTRTATGSRRPSARGTAVVAAGIVALAAVSTGVGLRLHDSATTAATNGDAAVARSDAAESGHGHGTAIVTGVGVPLAAAVIPAPTDGSDALVLVHGQSGSLALASGTSIGSPSGAVTVDRIPTTSAADPTAIDGRPAHGTAGSVVTSSGPISR